MLPSDSLRIVEYVDTAGRRPFRRWFERLDPQVRSRVTIGLLRLGEGNFSNVKSVGGGVLECKLNFGPGYRIYFGRDGKRLIVLLAGGTKSSQQSDIEAATANWDRYKQLKNRGEHGADSGL
jgi:putative addiction module killer protein